VISGVSPVHPAVMGTCIAGSQRHGAGHITTLCVVVLKLVCSDSCQPDRPLWLGVEWLFADETTPLVENDSTLVTIPTQSKKWRWKVTAQTYVWSVGSVLQKITQRSERYCSGDWCVELTSNHCADLRSLVSSSNSSNWCDYTGPVENHQGFMKQKCRETGATCHLTVIYTTLWITRISPRL